MKTSVVMITKNEQLAVKKVITDIKQCMPSAQILIVDSSTDKTPEIAESMGAQVIRQYPPQGYGQAMMLGLTQAEGDIIVTLDCDDTYPAQEIPLFCKLIEHYHYDIVDGCRLKHKPQAMPWTNYIGNRLFSSIATVLFIKPFQDLHSGMRAYKKTLIAELAQHINPHGAALPVELLLRSVKLNKRLKIVNIDYNERLGNSTMLPIETCIWTIKRIFRARFQ